MKTFTHIYTFFKFDFKSKLKSIFQIESMFDKFIALDTLTSQTVGQSLTHRCRLDMKPSIWLHLVILFEKARLATQTPVTAEQNECNSVGYLSNINMPVEWH